MIQSDTGKCENLSVAPNKPKTPTVSVRIDPELWQAAVAAAKARGETASDVIRRALLASLETGPDSPDRVDVSTHDPDSDVPNRSESV